MNNATEKPSDTGQQTPNFKPLLVIVLLVAFFMLMRQRIPRYHSIPPDLDSQASIAVLASYPHDAHSFTQGLVYRDGYLYESDGLYGQSRLRKLELTTGNVLMENQLEESYFAEGLAVLDGQLYQLTWKERTGFIYNLEDLTQKDSFSYNTEGWGLTTDGSSLILSDGTATLYFLDSQSRQTIRTIQVKDNGIPVERLNELEYIRGEVWANIWYSDRIVRIDPQDGAVLGWIDCGSLRTIENAPDPENVLNGVAYDSQGDRLFITGKNWSAVYEVELVNQPAATYPLP